MEAIEKILVVLDVYDEAIDKDALPVEVEKALRLVNNKSTARVHLLSCGYEKFLHDSYYGFGDELQTLRAEHCKRLEERLVKVRQKAEAQGYQVSAELVWGFPKYEQIAKKSVDFGADLVIQHTRPYAKLARTFLTNDTWQLVRYCPKPLLLVKDRPWKPQPVLLAAVDPVHSHHKPLKLDDKILKTAQAVSGHLKGDLHILHASAEAGRPFALPDKLLARHREALESLVAGSSIAPDHRHLVEESPVFALQQYEQKLGADIIVMGALSRSRLADSLIGNTAEQVLDYLESDVLIVKPQSIR